MLPRYILCVLTLVLCCSYVSLVSADSHESTGKFNNLMHGRNSSLSAQSLEALLEVYRIKYTQDANKALDKLNDAKRQAESDIIEGPVLEKGVFSTLVEAHSLKSTISGLSEAEKSQLINIANDAVSKAQNAHTKAGGVRSFAESDLEDIVKAIKRVRDLKNRINNATNEEREEIRKEIRTVTSQADSYLNRLRNKKEESLRQITAANETLAQLQEAREKIREKEKQQEQEKKTAADTSSTEKTQTNPSQQEITPVTQSTNVNGPTTESELTVDKEHPEQHKEKKEVPAVRKEAEGSSSTPVNTSNSAPVDTDSQVPVPDNSADEENQSLETAPEPDKEEIPEGAQEKEEGPKAPSVKPVEAGEKDKNQKEELEKDAQGSRENVDQNPKENTEEKDKTADLSNSSTPNIRNDMDGTNTLGWLHLLLLAVTALAYVAVY